MRRAAPDHRARAVHVALALLLASVALGTLAALIGVGLAKRTPGWFRPPAPDGAAEAAAVSVENRVGTELSRRREADAAWRLEVTQAEANAWLATRLAGWLEHEGVRWPEGLGAAFVELAPGRGRVAVERRAPGGRVVAWASVAVGGDGDARVRLAAAGLGSVAVPRGLVGGWVGPMLAEAAPADGDALADALARLASGEGLDPTTLRVRVDPGRVARVERLELDEGVVRLTLKTVARER